MSWSESTAYEILIDDSMAFSANSGGYAVSISRRIDKRGTCQISIEYKGTLLATFLMPDVIIECEECIT